MELIIIQDTKYPDLKLDSNSRVINNLSEFLHRLTVSGMVSLCARSIGFEGRRAGGLFALSCYYVLITLNHLDFLKVALQRFPAKSMTNTLTIPLVRQSF